VRHLTSHIDVDVKDEVNGYCQLQVVTETMEAERSIHWKQTSSILVVYRIRSWNHSTPDCSQLVKLSTHQWQISED